MTKNEWEKLQDPESELYQETFFPKKTKYPRHDPRNHHDMTSHGLKMAKGGKAVMPPWKQGAAAPMQIVHMTAKELEGLDSMQGGPSIDPGTGLREYSKLSEKFERPEVRELFMKVRDDVMDDGKLNTPPLPAEYKAAKKIVAPPPYMDAPGEHEDPAKQIERDSPAPDKHMALLPVNMVQFFLELDPTVSKNPETGLLQFFWEWAIPIASMIFSAFGENDQAEEEQKRWEERERIKQQRMESERERAGLNMQARHIEPAKWESNPAFMNTGPTAYQEPIVTNANPYTPNFRGGGMIKGPGDGQADKIKTTVPSGSYILSADVVSAFGNGSSDHGAKVLKQFASKLGKSRGGTHMQQGGETPHVPVYLSNDEYAFHPAQVDALGGGSNDRGAAMLKQMVKNIRKDQQRNGDNLPPAAKSPMQYMTRSGREGAR